MLKAPGTVSLATAVVLLAASAPARAAPGDGDSFLSTVECGTDGGAGCDIMLRWLQRDAAAPGDGGGRPAAPESSGGQGAGGTDWDAVNWDAVDWDAVDWDAIDWESVDYSQGGDEGGEQTADPMAALVESLDSFRLPRPEISSSPSPDALVLVKTPVWLWIDEEEWRPATAQADVPGLALQLTATPRATRWSMGDGTQVTCEGPGTAFDPAVHAADEASPDCGHVYSRSSAAEPSGTYTVTAEISWDITWEMSNGDTGELDTVTTTSQVEIAVQESQGLVTGSGA
ncbi:ATP/GTP-binding protein [Streptomonospora halophila]|uniref:ATP/GTP-binding protein n=1 Tax=Streptomonospora halophila TaxID=427369 RepID=A0ABP9H515_9ACTN